MATTVIIPARNEEVTIGKIVREFQAHPETSGHVYVAIDEATVDNTAPEAWKNGGISYHTGKHGKGENVAAILALLRNETMLSERIILCDADYSGLTTGHITQITTKYTSGMVVGVPDWPDIDVPAHVTRSWPMVSGFRCLPWRLIPENAHGYLLETQLQIAAIENRMSIIYIGMEGLKSPFRWPLAPQRFAAMEHDRAWGRAHGVL